MDMINISHNQSRISYDSNMYQKKP